MGTEKRRRGTELFAFGIETDAILYRTCAATSPKSRLYRWSLSME